MTDPLLQKYFARGFWAHVFAALVASVVIYYVIGGDSISLYYPEGLNMYRLILKDPSNIKLLFISGKNLDPSFLANIGDRSYVTNTGNYAIICITAFLGIFTFGKYMIISLFFSLISFSGLWRLYLFFYEQYTHLHKKLAIAILYLPTVVFWSSGLLKDPISIGALGWITFALYKIFIKREQIRVNTVIVVLSGYVFAIMKIYICVSYLPFFFLYLLLKNIDRIQSTFLRVVIGIFIIGISVLGGITVMNSFKEDLGSFAIENIIESAGRQQKNFNTISGRAESSFSLGVQLDGSIGSLVKAAPFAIVATLYRPFLWESKKLSTGLSSIESLVIMFFTLFVIIRVGLIRLIVIVFSDITVFYCLGFAVVFAIFIGATTLNFGTLVRYKIPCMPFYLIGLFLIQDNYKQAKQKRKDKAETEVATAI